VDPKTSKPLAEVLPEAPSYIAGTTTRSGVYVVGREGEAVLCGFGGTAFAKRFAAPRGFPTRESTCLGSDYQGDRLLLLSGRPEGYGPFPKDAWLLAEGKWKKQALTGAAPALTGAALTHDPERARWIVTGGRDKSYNEGGKTFETDERKWKAFPSSFI